MKREADLSVIEKKWILYDVGNSAFTMLISTIIPIYFKNLATQAGISGANSTAYWGYAASIATVIVAILGPVLGTMGDLKGYKKPLFFAFFALGVAGCAGLAMPVAWMAFLAIFIVAKVGFQGSLIFYDAMLPDITSEERVHKVSTNGYAWGYIGSCVPFVTSLLLILTADQTGLGTQRATMLAFLITALWWALTTLPLLRSYKQVHHVGKSAHPLRSSFARLWHTLTHIREKKVIFTFLLAFFLYIDGVYTIIEMATSYGKDVGISDSSLLLALLLTQVVAFPCALLFAKLSKKFAPTKLITACVAGYLGIALFALQLDRAWEFWFLAVCVAVFQGGVQALSRSYFTSIVPKENANEYFGLFDIFGKGAAFLGTMLMGIVTQATGHSRFGVGAISILFVLGLIAFAYHKKVVKQEMG